MIYKRRLCKVNTKWNSDLAYVIGLITADGNLSPDRRHINFTNKDLELAEHFKKCLNISNKIGRKGSGRDSNEKKYYCVQFGDINFYDFMLNIGLMPKKSKIIKKVDIPKDFFFDFLRGFFDGDGSFYSYWDPRWRSSFMFYTSFVSASDNFICWLRKELFLRLKVRGALDREPRKSVYQLKYAKKESLKIINGMYYNRDVVCLSRKRLKIEKALAIVGEVIN